MLHSQLLDLHSFGLVTFDLVIAVSCGSLLWRRRKDTEDRSRYILSFICFITAGIFFYWNYTFLVRSASETYRELLAVLHVTGDLAVWAVMLAYAVEVMRPRWLNMWWSLCLFLPLLMMLPLFLCSEHIHHISSFGDLLANIGVFNVWWRLCALLFCLAYQILLLVLPYNRFNSSASRLWVRRYVVTTLTLCLLSYATMFTSSFLIQTAQLIWIGIYIIHYTWFELRERLIPLPEVEPVPEIAPVNEELWRRIVYVIDHEQQWRNPDLTFGRLCSVVASNSAYVSQSFRRNANTTFVEYVNRRRIEFVVSRLKEDPHSKLQNLFYEAGYRTYSTAYRQFLNYTGVSPQNFKGGGNLLKFN